LLLSFKKTLMIIKDYDTSKLQVLKYTLYDTNIKTNKEKLVLGQFHKINQGIYHQ
jgi:hypothetical protein